MTLSIFETPVEGTRRCKVCGEEFKPAHVLHLYCDTECWRKENTAGGGVFAEQVKGLTNDGT